jgi:hypothetical protein
MQNYNDEGSICLICNNCGNVTTGNVHVSVVTELPLIAFETKFYSQCSKCGNACTECGDMISTALQILIEKNYNVVKSNQCDWGENLYDPYIKIRTGMAKLNPPDGWADVTDPAVHSFQVFAPDGSYGTASSSDDISEYAVQKFFECESDFNITRQAYIRQLEDWAIGLPENTDITTLKNVKEQFGANKES